MPTTHPRPTDHTTSEASSDKGPRAVNADALATRTDTDTGRTAFAVADGIGDHLLAARAARLVARTAATSAVRLGAVRGLLRAQRELISQFEQAHADAVLVVAVYPPADGDEEVGEIAWVGDCRAYRWNGRVLHQVTTDHTLAEFWRSQGRRPTARMEHIVTGSARTAGENDIGHARIGAGPGRLLLSSDGVHKSLELTAIKDLLAGAASPADAARSLVGAAREHGSTDNATALVVDRLLG